MCFTKWHLDFDARSPHLNYFLIRVRLLRLPLIIWSKGFFKEIGNALGILYEVDNSYHDSRYMGMGRIIVGLEISKVLVDSIVI
jgi:hypothetical protein